jgi:hypothetical protein
VEGEDRRDHERANNLNGPEVVAAERGHHRVCVLDVLEEVAEQTVTVGLGEGEPTGYHV